MPAWRVDKTFDYVVPAKLEGKIALGTLVRIPFGARVVRGFVLGLSEGQAEELETVKGVVIDVPLTPPPFDEVMTSVARRYVVPRGKAFARVVPPRVRTRPIDLDDRWPSIRPDRITVYEGGQDLISALRSRKEGSWCVQAVPGEDRGALIAELVSALPYGAAIILVPEVRYGSLVLDRVGNVLPLARLDSAQDEVARSSSWVAMAEGHRLGGGGRSAVFAPCPDLALIVIDEEHHQTYKEDRSPRYDARWVATARALAQGAACVFVSASPSIEAGWVGGPDQVRRVVPTRSQSRAARPIVELVDRPDDRSIGTELHQRISGALRSGRRVALLAPSAAFARAIWCGSCRRSLRCPNCEAGLFFDRSSRSLRCARCRFTRCAPETCPTCGAADFKLVGAGTERLGEQLAKSFPRARIHRVDPAAPSSVAAADVDIYLTTWMGTKPVLRPPVSLVGVLDADWLIRRPDFRAAESAYQAMAEMAEWAGPASEGGRLVIQTAEPNHHALQAVVRADHGFFVRKEIGQREELMYPPYVELIKVTVQGPDADGTAERIRAALSPLSTRVLGPVRMPGDNEQPVLQMMIKCHSVDPVSDALRVILEGAPKGVRITVDVDPR